MPELTAFKSPDAQCDDQVAWAVPPRLTYPAAYNRRLVEGWAVVRYDVASWGAVGNVTVLASEPTSDFGMQAQSMLRTARKAASKSGQIGCVERVKFVIKRPDADAPPSDGE